jgi:hypothetical protein
MVPASDAGCPPGLRIGLVMSQENGNEMLTWKGGRSHVTRRRKPARPARSGQPGQSAGRERNALYRLEIRRWRKPAQESG